MRFRRFTGFICFTLSFLASSSLMAAAETIANTSILLSDKNEMNARLSNMTPVWNEKFLHAMFADYKNPQKFQLPAISNNHVNDIRFIHAYFGPLNNPFNLYQRPAKVFLMFGDKFYMAPVIKNEADKNYYIFMQSANKPVLLDTWIGQLQHDHPGVTAKFNVCASYGSYPYQSCTASWQTESEDSSTTTTLAAKPASFNFATRKVTENWKSKLINTTLKTGRPGIYDDSIDWHNLDQRNALLARVNTWENKRIIQDNFFKLRDFRYFNDPQQSGFARRISWLYPDDGCWTRAAAVNGNLFGPLTQLASKTQQRPSKIFAFGNLCVNSANSLDGAVSWWYHTAPIVRDAANNTVYVLDPAVNAKQALKVEDWIAAISDKTKGCRHSDSYVDKINICSGYGSGPYDTCQETWLNENNTSRYQTGYLEDERERQVELGRDADLVLGKSPPWANS